MYSTVTIATGMLLKRNPALNAANLYCYDTVIDTVFNYVNFQTVHAGICIHFRIRHGHYQDTISMQESGYLPKPESRFTADPGRSSLRVYEYA